MRILYLTTESPWPPVTGGRVRSLAQLKLLASLPSTDRLTVFTLREEAVRQEDLLAFGRELPKAQLLPPVFHPIHLKRFPHYFAWVALLRLTRGLPYLAAKWVSPRVQHALNRALRGPQDLVYVDHLGMAAYLDLIRSRQPRARIVLEQHNVESDFFLHLLRGRTSALMAAIARREWRLAQRFERRAMKAVDAVVAISTSDAARLLDLTGVQAIVVPPVVEPARTPWSSGREPRLVYLGNVGWHPNSEGLDWFVRRVWPLVRQCLPAARFDIGGAGLEPGSLPEGWRVPGVSALGFIEHLEEFYDGAVAFLAPSLGGSGVQVKTLEAFRVGLPLVTTDMGARGLRVAHALNALIATDERAFAENVVRVCQDDALQRRLREGGFTYLEEHHGAGTAQERLREALGIGQASSPSATT